MRRPAGVASGSPSGTAEENENWRSRPGRRFGFTVACPSCRSALVLVRDPEGKLDPKAFLSTDLELDPITILRYFVRRWQIEVTFEEARRHLGMESQRQWSDLAIARTTPCLLGLFSIVTLAADHLHGQGRLSVRQSAWYAKPLPTFSDALAAIRRELWQADGFVISRPEAQTLKIPRTTWERLTDALAYAA